MKNTTVKKSLILVVALLLCVTVVFAACNKDTFQPLTEKPTGQTPEGNGGIAVKYGEWLYYINGYNSDTTATNGYTNDVTTTPRVGSVARIKLADLQGLFDIQDESNKTSTEKSEESEQYIRDKSQTVVPKIYYNGNTDSSTLELNGLYIFNDRIYITTPNDALTAGGDALTSQLVLMSFDIGGGDMKSHYTFTNNSVQIAYTVKDSKLCATFVMDSKIYYLNVDEGTASEVTFNGTDEAADIDNTYSSIKWDFSEEGKCLFFIDKWYNICKLAFGSDKYDVIVENGTAELHGEEGSDDRHIEAPDTSTEAGWTYTINSVNCGQVYYTKTTYSTDHKIYWAKSASEKDQVALDTNSNSSMKAWKNGYMVYTKAVKDSSFYGVYVNKSANGSESERDTILLPAANKSSVTIDRILGDTLYYTANSIKYTLDLNTKNQVEGTPYAKNLSSAAGWAQPDFFDYDNVSYILTATSGGLTIAKFDPANPDKSQTSVSLLLKAKAEDN